MNLADALLDPLLRADPMGPRITYYDDATGERIELSTVTLANWAAKTANLLRDELGAGPGTRVAVLLPAHWQTAAVLLGVWWIGAEVVLSDRTRAPTVALCTADRLDEADDAVAGGEVAVLSLDAFGKPAADLPIGVTDYATAVRVHGDQVVAEQHPGPALAGRTVADVLAAARDSAAAQGFSAADRVMSAAAWSTPDEVVGNLLAVFVAGASLVQVANPDPAVLERRRQTEKVTRTLDVGERRRMLAHVRRGSSAMSSSKPVVPVGQRALGVREDAARRRRRRDGRARGSPFAREEVVPRPRRQVDDLASQVLAGSRCRGSQIVGAPAPVALVVADRRGSRRRRRSAPAASRSRRAASHRSMTDGAGLDALTGRSADPGGARRVRHPGRALTYIARDAEAHAGERRGAARALARRKRRVRRRDAPQKRAGASTHGCMRQKSPRDSVSSATITSSTSSRSAIVRVCGRRRPSSARAASCRAPRSRRATACTRTARCSRRARGRSTRSPRRARTPRNDAAVAVPEPFDEPEPNADGQVLGVVRALGAAVHAALHAAVGHRRHVREAETDGTGGAQPLDRERVALRSGGPNCCPRSGATWRRSRKRSRSSSRCRCWFGQRNWTWPASFVGPSSSFVARRSTTSGCAIPVRCS